MTNEETITAIRNATAFMEENCQVSKPSGKPEVRYFYDPKTDRVGKAVETPNGWVIKKGQTK